ncbi:MAG: hypothetical protein BM557_02010 [Flavobacterium sp. MedPE-SWcel]|uniref:hypothetical protein n=1 Tax=uncultured Flavobacterium sp. TaxID=165435 RepID=UPI0009203B9F|nr:hypothetical protein [uncultured Flavobacterium sp.]OIQ22172.1 MAG: hypothetical protein BM557_02010 [Flavobacterium sp. MedPE-SWcel]
MNKKEKIISLKGIEKAAQELIAVSEQNLSIATRLRSEAISALKVLGASDGQTRKGKEVLSEKEKLSLLGQIGIK